jgi:hypothetical protein
MLSNVVISAAIEAKQAKVAHHGATCTGIFSNRRGGMKDNDGVLRQKTTKRLSPALGDILCRMTPAQKRKLERGAVGAISSCPQCAKAFVQRHFPRTFCSQACGKAHWRQEQERFLEAGRKYIDYVAQGLTRLMRNLVPGICVEICQHPQNEALCFGLC